MRLVGFVRDTVALGDADASATRPHAPSTSRSAQQLRRAPRLLLFLLLWLFFFLLFFLLFFFVPHIWFVLLFLFFLGCVCVCVCYLFY
jgi:hypothetical protein